MHIRKGQVLINAQRKHLQDLEKGIFRNNLESFCPRKLGVSQGHSHSCFLSTLTSGFRIPDSKIPFSSPASPLKYRFLYSVASSTFPFVHLIRSYTHRVQLWYFDFSHQTSFCHLPCLSKWRLHPSRCSDQKPSDHTCLLFLCPLVDPFDSAFRVCSGSSHLSPAVCPWSRSRSLLSRSAAVLCPLTLLELHSSSSSQSDLFKT